MLSEYLLNRLYETEGISHTIKRIKNSLNESQMI